MSNKDFRNDISDIIREALTHTRPCYVRVPSSLATVRYSASFREIVEAEAKGVQVIECSCADSPLEPYGPFMAFVRDKVAGLNTEAIEKLVKGAGVYPSHREAVTGYLSGNVRMRRDELIVDEKVYELRRYCSDMVALLSVCAGTEGLLFVVRDTREAMASVIRFARFLESRTDRSGISFVFLIETDDNDSAATPADPTDMFAAADAKPAIAANPQALARESSAELFQADKDRAVHLYNLGCFEESAELAQAVLLQSAISKRQIGTEESLALYHLACASNLNIGTEDRGLSDLYVMKAGNSGKPEWQARAFRLKAEIALSRQTNEIALQSASQSLSVSESGSHEAVFAEMLIFLASNSTTSSFLESAVYNAAFERSLKKLADVGALNHVAYLSSDSIVLLHLYRTGRRDKAFELCEHAIDIAAKLENEHRLSRAYHSYALLLQHDFRFDDAGTAYRKSLGIMDRIGNAYDRARLSNGFGFFYFSQGDFKQAFDMYALAMELLSPTEWYEELCTTMVNAAFCYIFTFAPGKAREVLETVIEIMDHLQIGDLPFHPGHYILSLLAYCYVQEGNMSKARELQRQIEESGLFRRQTRIDYYYLFRAALAEAKNETVEAVSFYDKALSSVEELDRETLHIAIFFLTALGRLYISKSMKPEAREIFSKALGKMTHQGQFPFFRALIESYMNRQNFHVPELRELAINKETFIQRIVTRDPAENRGRRVKLPV